MDNKEIRAKCIELALRQIEIVINGGEKVKMETNNLCVIEIAEEYREYIEYGTGKD